MCGAPKRLIKKKKKLLKCTLSAKESECDIWFSKVVNNKRTHDTIL